MVLVAVVTVAKTNHFTQLSPISCKRQHIMPPSQGCGKNKRNGLGEVSGIRQTLQIRLTPTIIAPSALPPTAVRLPGPEPDLREVPGPLLCARAPSAGTGTLQPASLFCKRTGPLTGFRMVTATAADLGSGDGNPRGLHSLGYVLPRHL